MAAQKVLGAKIEAGIFGAAGRETNDEGVTILERAMFAEFGTPNAPQRSWLRAWFDTNKREGAKEMRRLALQVVLLRLTRDEATQELGKFMVKGMQDRIQQGIAPRNAPSTVAKKGFDRPLIETGAFVDAIDWRKTT